ncbi:MAG TPA: KinB-signaling pathway activation protein [Pseudogracilibacillus sp.]|nr:KinB-signaling pathway activation protein [Pseudogracilibacillus sp.]
MNSRRLVQMFFKTLFIGGLIGLVTSFFVMSAEYTQYLNPIDFKELLGVTLFFLGYGLVFTVVAQTGFFAYLFINQYGGSIFKALWPTAQLLFVMLVIAALIYVPPKDDISLSVYIILAIILVIVGAIVSYFKYKQTNFTALIPALFLMIAMTVLEWTPVLRGGELDYMVLVLPTLLGANAYQLITLNYVTKVDEEHQRRQKERLKKREELKKIKQEKKQHNKSKKGKE